MASDVCPICKKLVKFRLWDAHMSMHKGNGEATAELPPVGEVTELKTDSFPKHPVEPKTSSPSPTPTQIIPPEETPDVPTPEEASTPEPPETEAEDDEDEDDE